MLGHGIHYSNMGRQNQELTAFSLFHMKHFQRFQRQMFHMKQFSGAAPHVSCETLPVRRFCNRADAASKNAEKRQQQSCPFPVDGICCNRADAASKNAEKRQQQSCPFPVDGIWKIRRKQIDAPRKFYAYRRGGSCARPGKRQKIWHTAYRGRRITVGFSTSNHNNE